MYNIDNVIEKPLYNNHRLISNKVKDIANNAIYDYVNNIVFFNIINNINRNIIINNIELEING